MVDSSTQRPELAKTAGEDPTRRRLTVSGFPVAIEYPAGSTKLGEDDDGKAWARVYLLDYGFIEGGPLGGDGETLDVYVGPSHDALQVFVVNQLKKDGSFDETKCMLGFTSLEDAKRGYLMHYPEGWEADRLGSIRTMGVAEFRKWLGGPGVAKAARVKLAHAAEEVGKEVTAALALQPKLAKAELEQIVLAAPTWKRCSADWDPAYQAQVLKRAALAVDTHLAGRAR